MLNLILRLLITMVALKGADFFLPNFNLLGNFWSLMWFSILLGLLNWLIKPVLVFFSIPLIVLTIGLFYFVINALLIYFTSVLFPGELSASTFGIFFGSILVSLFHWLLTVTLRTKSRE